jgi:hypothetical protein
MRLFRINPPLKVVVVVVCSRKIIITLVHLQNHLPIIVPNEVQLTNQPTNKLFFRPFARLTEAEAEDS